MAAVILRRSRGLLPKSLPQAAAPVVRVISTFPSLSQMPQPQAPDATAPLPPNASTGSPFYLENWRSPNTSVGVGPLLGGQALVPLGSAASARMMICFQTFDLSTLKNLFTDWLLLQNWSDLKRVFEYWIRSLDISGKPNKPDLLLFNQYLRANQMMGASAGELLDLVAQMQDYQIAPNTASYNLVLEAMVEARETEAAQKLADRMLQTGTMPDYESYNLVIGLSIHTNQIDSALKYVDSAIMSGYVMSSSVFMDCVRSCVKAGKLDTLASIIERCKTTDRNKHFCPSWDLCNHIADVALQADHSKLAYFALEFLARWIIHGEMTRPPVLHSAEEGLAISAFTTSGRTFDSTLLEAAWSILRRSLRKKKAPSPEAYIAKIYAHASLGQLQRAFSTLNEFETVYGNSNDTDQELFSPFSSLYPLVVACCKNGLSTLDSVYIQLENLSQADPPFKSVAALNCVILGCANIWDLDRAYETFGAISDKIGLTPNIHSYNALLSAFGKLKKTDEACQVFKHLVSLDVKPNAMTYSLLVDAHLVNRDPKAALSAIDEMIEAGFTPSKESLKKLRRRCFRELDFDSDEKVQSLAQRLGAETRREILYNLEYSTNYLWEVDDCIPESPNL